MDKKIKVLVVDDEQHIVDFITMGLELEGYEVEKAYDGESAIECFKADEFDLAILDVMLPKMNGYDVCRQFKNMRPIPIIMLSAKGEVEEIVHGLDCGANDYIAKPFHFKELLARIKVQIREIKHQKVKTVTFGDFEIYDDKHEIIYQESLLNLSPTEYNLLHYLIINHDLVLSKTKILDNVWGHDFFGEDNIVEVYIRYLRNKLNDSDHKIIKTVRGAGYRLVLKHE